MITTITRQQLRDVAERALERTRRHADVSDEFEAQVREVAETTERIAGHADWWLVGSKCGCLAGTIVRGKPESYVAVQLGGEFIDAMREVTGSMMAQRAAVLEVVD